MALRALKRTELHSDAIVDGKRMYNLQRVGYSIAEIAEAYGVSRATVYDKIKKFEFNMKYDSIKVGKTYEFIDMPKVFALKRAGWSDRDIAYEIHRSEEMVPIIIKEWQQDTGLKEVAPV